MCKCNCRPKCLWKSDSGWVEVRNNLHKRSKRLATLSGSSTQQNLHVIQTSNRFTPLANLQNHIYHMHQENCTHSSNTQTNN